MAEGFDLVVIGGGSGGLAAAQRAAEYGARVVLVEPDALGGTCVNRGCVPKKIMWNAAELGSALHDARDYGFGVEERGLDWPLLRARREAYIERLNGLYAANLAKRNVELIRARAAFLDAHNVSADGRTLAAAHIVVASGGRPLVPPIPGAELGITSDGFFTLDARPGARRGRRQQLHRRRAGRHPRGPRRAHHVSAARGDARCAPSTRCSGRGSCGSCARRACRS